MGHMQNGAANVAHPVREIDQAGQRVSSEHREKRASAQYRLIAKIIKNARSEFRLAIRDCDGCEARL